MNVLITIPHSSTLIPSEFRGEFLLKAEHMNKHLDFGTEKIFDLPGFPVLKATASRFVADLNRERDDLRPGQGVVITETWDGEPVLNEGLSPESVEARLSKHYDSFYMKLDSYLRGLGRPLFVLDGHSMDSRGSLVSGDSGKERPDLCLALGKGRVNEGIVSMFERAFREAGYSVGRNNPYSGERAKIMHYCRDRGADSLELEVNKKIYMNEKTLELNERAAQKLRGVLLRLLDEVKEL